MCQAHSNDGAGYVMRGPVNLYTSYLGKAAYSSSALQYRTGRMYK